MGFKGMTGGVDISSFDTYDLSKNGKNTAFKNMDYSDIEEIDYTKYVEVDATDINTEDKSDSDPWYKVAADYCATATGSLVFGVLEVVENIGDGLILAGGAIASGVVGLFNKDLGKKIKEGTQKVIQYDWTEAGYTASMNALGVDEDIAFGVVHDVGSMVGTATGYIALSLVPGGAAVAATAGALGAAGSAAEMAFNQGATFEEALTVSAVAGVAGAVTGGVTNKIGAAAKGATTLGQVGKYALSGAAVAMTEPVINSTAEYLVYGQDIVDANGNKVYGNFGDYYVGSGGALNTVIAGGVGGVSAGLQGLGGYKANKAGNVELYTVVEDQYDSNLERKIFDRMPQQVSELEQTKYIYNKLNEEMAYSSEYFFSKDSSVKGAIYNQSIDLGNVDNNKIVCSNWSEMYAELLNKNGINAKVMGQGHKWVVFELSDGSKWLADATQPYNGFTDLTNAKTGTKSGGFFQITDDMYNSNSLVQGSDNMKNAYGYSKSYFDDSVVSLCDDNLGYDYKSIDDLFGESTSQASGITMSSSNSTYGELAAMKLENIVFSQMENLDTMEGLGYYSKMKNVVLNSFEKDLVSGFSGIQKPNGDYYITFSVDLQNGYSAEYIYDGKGNLTKDLVKKIG